MCTTLTLCDPAKRCVEGLCCDFVWSQRKGSSISSRVRHVSKGMPAELQRFCAHCYSMCCRVSLLLLMSLHSWKLPAGVVNADTITLQHADPPGCCVSPPLSTLAASGCCCRPGGAVLH
jgi:hypothetical protein